MSKDEPRPPTHIAVHAPPADAPVEHAQHAAQSAPHRTPLQVEFPPGEDTQTHDAARNVALSSRIGSTGSQLVSQVNEVRKRTGRRVHHRPKPLDLDHARLHGHTSSQQQQQPQQHSSASGPGSESNQPSAAPLSASGPGLGLLPTSPAQKEPKHRAKFPLLQIKTDLNRASTSRRPAPVTGTATNPSDVANPANVTNNTTYTHASNGDQLQQHQHQHPPERKAPSKWQLGLERMLKKIERRKRAPSNLTWYAAHSTESYLSGATLESRPGISKQEVDADADSLHHGNDKPPQWVVNSLQRDNMFFSDDTVELVIGLRDYLIKATDSGWDITELKEEIFST
ncbi:hypothetical protein BGZ67_008521 [Mortierella alpina]|nr:hypothetical protein BGZ67_008521 [Mortierella alpina]